MASFFAMGMAASATYVINDLWDLSSDRRHWSKRNRPMASGDLAIREGLFLAAAGLAGGFAIAALIGHGAVIMLALYVAVTLSYSFALKRVPILDVFTLGCTLHATAWFRHRARGRQDFALAPGVFHVRVWVSLHG